MSALAAALLAGATIGVRHSFEADHVAAVATLVDDRTATPGRVGAAWGVGHAVPILAAGVIFLALGTTIPDIVAHVFEPLAGAVLVFLGIRSLVAVRGPESTRSHGRDEPRGPSHTATDTHHDPTARDGGHDHVSVGPVSMGLFHSHRGGESLAVGLVHGFAGTGALVALLAATAPTIGASATFLLTFAVTSIVTMACLALIWDRLLGTAARHYLRGVAGFGSITIGALLVAREALALLTPL